MTAGDPTGCFRATYAEARERFRAAASRAQRGEHVHPSARGSAGELLSIDTALVGRPNASALLLVSSGTHGVEGFAGAGCQAALLADASLMHAAERAGVAVLFVHALNPYGFSHLRRVNEDNVDLNRNFRDFSQPPPDNPLYAQIHPALLPAQWPPTEANQAAIGALVARHGLAVFQAVVSGGQYAFPDGMFYGGREPAWSQRVMRGLLREHGAHRERLAWIDIHTGLGPAGHGEKIFGGRDDAAELARARAWWGADVTSYYEGSSTSAALQGAMQPSAYEECPHAQYTGVTLEFGTLPLPEVFTALRGDHWLHLHPEASADLRDAIQRRMRAAFYPDTASWKAQVYAQTREIVGRTLDCLAGSR